MIGKTLAYFLNHPLRLLKAIAADPREAWIKFEDRYHERRERRRPIAQYQADPDWEGNLHTQLGVLWPCQACSQFWTLWPEVIAALETSGIRVGPMGFGSWNDGDAALIRAIWCLVYHRKPKTIVETGVGHGMTSRFVLEALERNAAGHLWSIDLPPIDPALRAQVGLAVGKSYAEKWTYIEGSSRRRLPALLARLGSIDLFIHDSLHSERNVRFELDRAWAALRPGGAIVVDDIDANGGFRSFTSTFSGQSAFVCEAEPLHPDLRRFNKRGLFGVILKASAGREAEKLAGKSGAESGS
jgi:Methyltransferase domain